MPEELDKLDRQIRQLEIEREAIKRENDEEKLKPSIYMRRHRPFASTGELFKNPSASYNPIESTLLRLLSRLLSAMSSLTVPSLVLLGARLKSRVSRPIFALLRVSLSPLDVDDGS